MEIETIKISELKPYEKNARTHPKAQLELLKKNIERFGFTTPCLIDKDNELIAGQGRLEAVKELDWTEVPCVRMENLSKEEVKALRIADNKLAEMAQWDMDLLLPELKELSDEDFDLTGFDKDLIIEPGEKDDEVPEVPEMPEEPKSKLGDLYELGEHRVLTGDSTKIEDVEKLMDGKKADMVFTDPPYGMGKEKDGVQNDNLYNDKLLAFNRDWIPLAFSFLKDNGSWYCWGTDEPLMDIYSEIIKPYIDTQKATFRNLITWDKGHGQGQLSEEFRSYAVADEKCLFIMMGVQEFNNNADNYFEGWEPIRLYLDGEKKKMGWSDKWIAEQMGIDPRLHWFSTSQWELPTQEKYQWLQKLANGDAFKREYDEIKREWYETRAYFDNTHDNMNNVWHFDRTSNTEREGTGKHATPKPLELCEWGIKSSSRAGEIVMDPFLGSGSTLIASEKTGRVCYGMELDPKYIDVIVQRYVDYVDNPVVKLNGKDVTELWKKTQKAPKEAPTNG